MKSTLRHSRKSGKGHKTDISADKSECVNIVKHVDRKRLMDLTFNEIAGIKNRRSY